MNKNIIIKNLDIMFPNPKCELNYTKDYELLIATMLSAQSTDKRVNTVTKILFKYDIYELSQLNVKTIEKIIYPVGTFRKKSDFILKITKALISDHQGQIPNNRKYLENLPGVGRKTANVVLANIFNEPTFAIDTHMIRVTNILNLVQNEKDVNKIEKKLMKMLPQNNWNRINDQLILFGRYICKAKKPECSNCLFYRKCEKTKNY